MSKIKYVTSDDTGVVSKLQDKAIKSVHSSRVAIQIALVATACHICKHGDYTIAQRLVDGLGNGVNQRAVIDWLVTYAGVTVAEDGKGFGGLVPNRDKIIRERFEDAKATMWWELKIQQPFKGFNLEQALKHVISKHKSAVEKAGEDDKLVSMDVSNGTLREFMTLIKFDQIIEASKQPLAEQEELPPVEV